MQTVELTRTAEKLAEMFTENTGTHMLDSGGASGRHWQRNAGKTAADFLAAPEGWGGDYGLTISAFHFCNRYLEFDSMTEGMTNEFRAWVDKSPKWPDKAAEFHNACGSLETWLEETLGITEAKSFNTYNWDNLLSQVLQGVEFELGDLKLVALSIHGGADVRGGYSDLVIFRACECWLYQSGEAFSSCDNLECRLGLNVRGCDVEFYDFETGDCPSFKGWEFEHGCPQCKKGKFTEANFGECFC